MTIFKFHLFRRHKYINFFFTKSVYNGNKNKI